MTSLSVEIHVPTPPPVIAGAVHLVQTKPDAGCSSCGRQDTATLDPRFGRRCASCPPWLSLAEQGRVREAFGCLRWFLAGEAVRRFGEAG